MSLRRARRQTDTPAAMGGHRMAALLAHPADQPLVDRPHNHRVQSVRVPLENGDGLQTKVVILKLGPVDHEKTRLRVKYTATTTCKEIYAKLEQERGTEAAYAVVVRNTRFYFPKTALDDNGMPFIFPQYFTGRDFEEENDVLSLGVVRFPLTETELIPDYAASKVPS